MKNGLSIFAVSAVGIFLTTGQFSRVSAQTTNWIVPKTSITNVIPANIFLTDDGKLFWYSSSKKGQFVHLKDIADATNSPESRPADSDPEGNWGIPVNGLQLSLRFDKQVFTNGEQAVANMLLRNITNVPVKFERYNLLRRPSPIGLWVFKGAEKWPIKGDNDEITVISATDVTIYPQTQRKFSVKLSEYYDLSPGEFIIQAVYGKDAEISSQKVPIKIGN